MKTLLTCLLALIIAGAASAQQTMTYGWEDGGEMLSCYTCDGMGFYNDNTVAEFGNASLALTEVPGNTNTPQAYVAWVTGLADGDQVTASFDVLDDTIGGNPSIRIWGHWSDPLDIDAYVSSAGGNSTYSGAVGGWETLSYTWTAGAGQEALVIEARPYESTSATEIHYCWLDNLVVTAPDGATIHLVSGTVATESASWGDVKALYR